MNKQEREEIRQLARVLADQMTELHDAAKAISYTVEQLHALYFGTNPRVKGWFERTLTKIRRWFGY